MGVKKKLHEGKYIRLAVVFILCVFAVIAASLIWKAFIIYSASSFDGKSEFILGVNDSRSSNIIIFLPGTSKINDIYFEGVGDSGKVAQTLNVPLDKAVTAKAEKTILPNFWSLKLNIFDRLRLWLFAKTLADKDISFVSGSDTVLPLFIDKTLYQEGETIQVVNAGEVYGNGSNIGRLLTNIGANVISIVTADNVEDKTTIQYSGNKSYTVSRLEKIFGVNSQKLPKDEPSTIADIIVTIGKSQ